MRNQNVYEHGRTERNIVLSWEEYSLIPAIFCNRDWLQRWQVVAKLLNEKPNSTQLEIAIVKYPDGRMEIADSNTRKYCWETGKASRPNILFATIYHVANQDEARAIYDSYDSDKSVEKSSHKFTGAFRELNMDIRSKNMKKGTALVNTMLDAIRHYPDASIPKKATNPKFIIESTRLFKNEILKLDEILLSFEQQRITVKPSTILKTVIFMMMKKYGTNNQKLLDGINQLFRGRCLWTGNGQPTDGISFINKELERHHYTPQSTRHQLEEQLDFYLTCFDRWMSDTQITIYRRPERLRSPYRNFYNDFVENNTVRRRGNILNNITTLVSPLVEN
jgi:hypothetical protein